MINLDTHILLFALLGDLKRRERTLLAQHEWGISAIVLWEIAKLQQLARISIDLKRPEVSQVFSAIHVWPISLPIALTSCNLDFASDPADELIAATSICHDAPLLTRDKRMARSRLVPLA